MSLAAGPSTIHTPLAFSQESNVINGLDFGPLAKLVGEWKSVESGGVDIAPGQEGSKVGKGGPAVEPFYETTERHSAYPLGPLLRPQSRRGAPSHIVAVTRL